MWLTQKRAMVGALIFFGVMGYLESGSTCWILGPFCLPNVWPWQTAKMKTKLSWPSATKEKIHEWYQLAQQTSAYNGILWYEYLIWMTIRFASKNIMRKHTTCMTFAPGIQKVVPLLVGAMLILMVQRALVKLTIALVEGHAYSVIKPGCSFLFPLFIK